MTIIYRISNNSYKKNRLKTANKKYCLLNALSAFDPKNINWIVLGDNINEDLKKDIDLVINLHPSIKYIEINGGSGAKSFNIALDYALTYPEDEIIYFLEDDYLHLVKSAFSSMNEGFELNPDYFTLYLHPDKFISPLNGGNPNVDYDGGYLTKIYKGKTQLFALFDSTTMTFASKVKTLKEDEEILRNHTSGEYPRDYDMFISLRNKGRSLLCPLKTHSTHTEIKWLSPYVNWNKI